MGYFNTGKTVEVLGMNEVQKEMGNFVSKDAPRAIARGFSRTAKQGEIAGKRELTRGLTLRSKWILNGVKGMPLNEGQQNAFVNSYKKYGIADGSVYIRGATQAKKELSFLLNHETGKNRIAHNRLMAIPLRGLREWKNSDWRTTSGRTKKRLKPSRLLGDEYNKAKDGSFVAVFTGKTLSQKRRKRKRKKGASRSQGYKPFIINSKRSKTSSRHTKNRGSLKILYKFQKVTKQSRKIMFGDVVEEKIIQKLRPNVIRELRRIQPT